MCHYQGPAFFAAWRPVHHSPATRDKDGNFTRPQFQGRRFHSSKLPGGAACGPKSRDCARMRRDILLPVKLSPRFSHFASRQICATTRRQARASSPPRSSCGPARLTLLPLAVGMVHQLLLKRSTGFSKNIRCDSSRMSGMRPAKGLFFSAARKSSSRTFAAFWPGNQCSAWPSRL
jgi:hypothetical protein